MYITCVAALEFITRCHNFIALRVLIAAVSPFELHFPSVPVLPLDQIMAPNAKIALVFMLLLATAMAAQAKKVSVKNKYCKPVTVNGVVIEADVEVEIDLNELGTLVLEVKNLLGGVVKETYSIPLDVTVVGIVQDVLGLVVEVLDAVTTTVGSLLGGVLNVSLQVCVKL